MRNLSFALLLLLAPTAAAAHGLAVALDQAVRLTLPAPAMDVIVGNPAIADVTVADRWHIVVTGKAYGVTNLVVADGSGRTILERQVVVSAPDQDRVSVFRGPEVDNFACSPNCERLKPQGGEATQSATTP
jgi:Flp pilus assembly secretin CpaC